MFDWASIITKAMPAVVGVLYTITAIAFFMKHDFPWGLVWISYAAANLGLILAEANR